MLMLGSKMVRNLKGCGDKHNFQQYFNYILAVSFIGGGNWSTRKKTNDPPQVTVKPALSHEVVSSTLHHEGDSN